MGYRDRNEGRDDFRSTREWDRNERNEDDGDARYGRSDSDFERQNMRPQHNDMRSQGRGFRDEDFGHSRFYSPQQFDEQRAYSGPTGSYSGYRDRSSDRGQFRDEDWNRNRVDQGYYGSRAHTDTPDQHFSERGAYGRGGQRLGGFGPDSYGSRFNRSSNFGQRDFEGHYGQGRTSRSYGQSSVYGTNGGYPGSMTRRYESEGARGEYRGPREESWTQNVRDEAQSMMRSVKRAFRGPKGYTRSDERIREDISDRLGQQDEVDPSEIEVRVQNGEVTLTGTVQTRHEKFVAEEITDEVSGVREINNQIRVRRAEDTQTPQTSTTTTQAQPPNGVRNGRA